jgi:Tfp pilus assembly protein PilV
MLNGSRTWRRERYPSGVLQSCTRAQRGSLLLEASIAIGIFSFGIIGLFGVLSASIRASNDARLRTEAACVAHALIAEMWTMRAGAMDAQFVDGGAAFAAWESRVARLLPAATLAVDVTEPGLSAQSQSVVVTLTWLPPGSNERHRYVTSAQIGRNT